MSKACVCILLSARASPGTCRHGNLLPWRPPFVVGTECAGYWNTDQEHIQKHLPLLFCCCFGKVCLLQDPWLCGLVGWCGRALASPQPAPGGCAAPQRAANPPSSSRPRSGNCPVGKILLTLVSRGRSAGMWGQVTRVTLLLFPSLRPHLKIPPLQTEMFSGCRV